MRLIAKPNEMPTMKIVATLLAAVLVTATTGAAAYENFQGMETYYPNTPWLRGNFDNWGKTPLVAENVYQYNGVSYATYVNILSGTQTVKFDTSAAGDWSTNYGDNNLSDNCLDSNGANIPLTLGAGSYEVVYSTGAPGYGCGRPFYSATKLNTYTANYRTMYLRTSFNSWGLLPMYLVRNNVWEAPVTSPVNTTGYLKFDSNGDWVTSFGIPVGSNPQSSVDMGTAVKSGSNIGLYVEDYSGAKQISAVIRFNDQTLQYSYCPVNEPVSFNTALCK